MPSLRNLVSLGLLAALACHPPRSEAPEPTAAAPQTTKTATKAEILAASELPPVQPEAIAGDPMGVTVHRLENGMTVYISTDRREPRFAGWVVVRSGGRNDPADSTGLAHYLEHMMFKGTDELGTLDYKAELPHLRRIEELYDALREAKDPAARAKLLADIDRETQATAQWVVPNELSRIYASLGITGVNAFTNWDATVYEANVPSNRFEAWAEIEAERFRDAKFRLFQPELEAVYEEKNKRLDDPWRQVLERLLLALFPDHPYGTQPVIGHVEHLKTPAYGDMVAYHQRWYVPNNMAIVLTGDIDAATTLPVLERTLGTLEPKPLAEPSAAALDPVRGRIARELITEGEEEVYIAWRSVSSAHVDEPAMTVLLTLLGAESRGMLALELELTQKVAGTSAAMLDLRESGFCMVMAVAREGQSLEEVEQLLMGVVAKLRAGEIEQSTIDAIVLHEDIAQAQLLESNESRARELLDVYIDRLAWPKRLERNERLRTVTKADVISAANKYLGDDRAVVYRRRGTPNLPKIEKPKLTPLEVDSSRESGFSRKIAAIPAKALEPEWLVEGTHYERRSLPAGPLVVAHNPRNELFEVTLVVERGERKDRLLCQALRLLELSGTKTKSAEALRDELYALGTSIRFECDTDDTKIVVDGLDRNLEASLGLLHEWFDAAVFDAATLAGLDDIILSERQGYLDNPESLRYLLSDYAFFGKASGYLVEPTNRQLQAAKPAALAKLARGLLDYRRDSYYFGPRRADEAAQVLARALPLRGTPRNPGPYPALEYREIDEPTIYFVHKDVAQTAIDLAIPQGGQPRARVPESLVMDEYFDGDMASLLFLEIRETRSLAYECGGYQDYGSRPGDEWAFLGNLQTQGDKTAEAITTYLEVIGRPVDASRLANVKEALDQRYRSSRVDPRAVPQRIRRWDLRGETSDPRPWEWKASTTMELDGLELVATLRSRPPILALVGDRKRIDMQALGRIGKVVEVQPDELVSYGAFPKGEVERSGG